MTCKSCGLEKRSRSIHAKFWEIGGHIEDIQDVLDSVKMMLPGGRADEAHINKLILKIRDFKRMFRRISFSPEGRIN